MTDDFDIGALLVSEMDRRNRILDKAVAEELSLEQEGPYTKQILDLATPEQLAEDLMKWTPTFAGSQWELDHIKKALIGSCQRWLDALRSAVQA